MLQHHTSLCSLVFSRDISSASAAHALHEASSSKGRDDPTKARPPVRPSPPPSLAVTPAAPPRAPVASPTPVPSSPNGFTDVTAGVRGPYRLTNDRCTPLGTATNSLIALRQTPFGGGGGCRVDAVGYTYQKIQLHTHSSAKLDQHWG